MAIRMAPASVAPGLAGAYLIDGRTLYRVGAHLKDTDLWQVEDCRTLHWLLLRERELRSNRLRRVLPHRGGCA